MKITLYDFAADALIIIVNILYSSENVQYPSHKDFPWVLWLACQILEDFM